MPRAMRAKRAENYRTNFLTGSKTAAGRRATKAMRGSAKVVSVGVATGKMSKEEGQSRLKRAAAQSTRRTVRAGIRAKAKAAGRSLTKKQVNTRTRNQITAAKKQKPRNTQRRIKSGYGGGRAVTRR